ncbi:MAG: ArsA family ATPase [Acidimicrobiales bacterium]
MDVAAFCASSRVLVVAGKGGVGKTTTVGAMALTAALHGLSVLIVDLEGRPTLPRAFGQQRPLSYDGLALFDDGRGSVTARSVTPDEALLEYLADHGFKRISRRLVASGVIDVVSTAIPGIADVLVLGKVKQLEKTGAADLILVDAPATGHAVTLLTSAAGLSEAARSGPLRSQAAEVLELLNDPARCRVALVTIAEEMPVTETIEAAYRLEDVAGVQLAPIVVNGIEEVPEILRTDANTIADNAGVELDQSTLSCLEEARKFAIHREALQRSQLERLGAELPLPQLRLPSIEGGLIGPRELESLSRALAKEVGRLPAEPCAT